MVFGLDLIDNVSVVRTTASYILFTWEFKLVEPSKRVEARFSYPYYNLKI